MKYLLFSNFDIQAQINLNQSRVEEITMKEDLVSTNFITDDNFFGDTPFGETNEKEMLRAGSALDESVYKESDASKITIEEEKDENGDKSSVNKSTLGSLCSLEVYLYQFRRVFFIIDYPTLLFSILTNTR